jgi:hypothetical protein
MTHQSVPTQIRFGTTKSIEGSPTILGIEALQYLLMCSIYFFRTPTPCRAPVALLLYLAFSLSLFLRKHSLALNAQRVCKPADMQVGE